MTTIFIAILLGIFFIYLSTSSPFFWGLVFGLIETGVFYQVFGKFPLSYIGIKLHNEWAYLDIFAFSIITFIASSILKNYEKNKLKKEEEEHNAKLYDSPIEIVSFGSRNNLFTVGNNTVAFEARNNSYDPILFKIELKYANKWEEHYKEFKIKPKSIERYDILGKAWNRAEDIRISYWR